MSRKAQKQKERKLRKEIKEILEANRGLVERVHDTHGQAEHGCDLILLKNDAFGQLRAYCAQVKTGDLKCSQNRTNKGIRELIGQLAIAFGEKVSIDGKDYTLDGIYVITDGEISKLARNYIRSALVGIRNIYFLDKQALDEFRGKFASSINTVQET